MSGEIDVMKINYYLVHCKPHKEVQLAGERYKRRIFSLITMYMKCLNLHLGLKNIKHSNINYMRI